MVFHDPPYGLGIAEWDKAAPSLDEMQSLIGRLSVLIRNKPWVYISDIHPSMRTTVLQSLAKHNLKDFQDLCWCKTGHQNGHDSGMTFTPSCEPMVVGYWRGRGGFQIGRASCRERV